MPKNDTAVAPSHAEQVTQAVLECRALGHAWPRRVKWVVDPDTPADAPRLARQDLHCECGVTRTEWRRLDNFRERWGEFHYDYPPGYLASRDPEDESPALRRDDYKAQVMARDLKRVLKAVS